MYRLIVFLLVIVVGVSCSEAVEPPKEEPQELIEAPVVMETKEEKKIEEPKLISSSNNSEINLFDRLTTKNKGDTKSLEKQLKIVLGLYNLMSYETYLVEKDKLLIMVFTGMSCAETECSVEYDFFLLSKEDELLSKEGYAYWDSEGEVSIDVVANSVIACVKEVSENNYDNEYYWVHDGKFEDLSKSTKADLRLARNTIYARKGYKFKSEDLQNHFNAKDWYEPKYDKTDGLLSDLEESVAQALLKLEKEK